MALPNNEYMKINGLRSNQAPFYYTMKLLKPPVQAAQPPKPEVAHHILVIDRSGSMYSDMDALKASIEQVLAVSATVGSGTVETTLISFSSSGDLTLHWAHVPAEEAVKLNGPYLPKLRSIRATYLTGISQGLNLALDQVKADQTTGITLFTDGYANDPGPAQENAALDAFVDRVLHNFPQVFVNCIGYREWCDWNRLGAIANALSGKCIQAKSVKDVHKVMEDTQALLAGRVNTPITVYREESATPPQNSYILFVNHFTGQVNMTRERSLTIRGIKQGTFFEFLQIDELRVGKKPGKALRALWGSSKWPTAALSLGFLGLGLIRKAKEVLFASGNRTLWDDYQAAITPTSIVSFGEALCRWLVEKHDNGFTMGRNALPKHNIFTFIDAVNGLPTNSILINLNELKAGYKRRTIQKVTGTRQPDGTLIPPNAKPVIAPETGVRSLEFNTSEATLQLNLDQSVQHFVDQQGNSLNHEFAALGVSSRHRFRLYNSYTLLSSGEWNVPVLRLRAQNKAAWAALTPYAKGKHGSFNLKSLHTDLEIPLTRLRAESKVNYNSSIGLTLEARNQAAVRIKLLSAMEDKAEASALSEDQIEGLKKYHITSSLYYSPPTTTHYVDREAAIKNGEIDSYTRYKVHIGTVSILNTDEFRSGNAFLARRYVTKQNGQVVDKAKLSTYTEEGTTYELKPPGRAVDTAADKLMATVADAWLLPGFRMSPSALTQRLKDARQEKADCDELLQPLVVEIGCTGLLPPEIEIDAVRYDADAFEAKYPGVKLGKDQRQGVFYVIPNSQVLSPADPIVISVVPEVAWYTVRATEGQD